MARKNIETALDMMEMACSLLEKMEQKNLQKSAECLRESIQWTKSSLAAPPRVTTLKRLAS